MTFHALLSYAQLDDTYSEGSITQLKEVIEREVRKRSGDREFKIFRDINDIQPGQAFEDIIESVIDGALIIIAVITPSYFKSESCLDEFEQVLEKENSAARSDLILPIYFLDSLDMNNAISDEDGGDERVKRIIRILHQRQYVDLRKFYDSGFYDKGKKVFDEAKLEINKIGNAITNALRIHDSKVNSRVDTKFEPAKFTPIPTKEIPTGLYKERLKHYKAEKEFLANHFGDFLLARIMHLCVTKKVLLFIDSGSTLYNFFNKITDYARLQIGRRNNVLHDSLFLITNNLAGAQWLMKNGRISENEDAEIAINCIVLPGEPTPKYYATITSSPYKSESLSDILGVTSTHNTINSIGKLKNEIDAENVVIISLLSGNWIRIRQTVPRIALPLSRGAGQLEVKQALVDISDEVYLISPLGKIFAGHQQSEVEKVLNAYLKDKALADSYSEVHHAGNKIRLITTYRAEGDLLFNLSEKLAEDDFLSAHKIEASEIMNLLPAFRLLNYDQIPNYMFEYPSELKTLKSQLNREFPHQDSRKKAFIKYFHLSDELLDRIL